MNDYAKKTSPAFKVYLVQKKRKKRKASQAGSDERVINTWGSVNKWLG